MEGQYNWFVREEILHTVSEKQFLPFVHAFFSSIKNLHFFIFEVLSAHYFIIFLSPGGGGFEAKTKPQGQGNGPHLIACFLQIPTLSWVGVGGIRGLH